MKRRCKLWQYLIRPARGATDVLRLTTRGRWVPDDQELGVAFSARAKSGYPVAYYPDRVCACYGDKCPKIMASDKTCARFGASNGRPREPRRKR